MLRLACRSAGLPAKASPALSGSSLLRPLSTGKLLSAAASEDEEKKPAANEGFFARFLGPDAARASPSFKARSSMFLPAFATHVCLGAPYGWSAISAALSREYGIVASSSADWMLDQCTYPMSIMIAAGGISAAVFGKWTIKVGTRFAMASGGSLFGLGFLISSMGVAQHNLPMLYAGNLLCGIGYGCAYTPPIQALLEWFPDKKGLASGIVIAGFGCGALFFSPMMNALMASYSKMPVYLGKTVETVTEGGKMFAQTADGLQEVVFATAADLAKLPYTGLSEGFYVAGTGSTGVGAALGTMAAIYASTVVSSAFLIRKPAPGYVPDGWTPPEAGAGSGTSVLPGNVDVTSVMKTPQFWLLFSTSTLLCTGGMGLMSVAKPMIADVFTSSMPQMVTAAFASSYLMAMAGGNLGGRLIWAAVSDKIGRKATFNLFTLGSVPIFASLPYCINQVVLDPTGPMAPAFLAAFCGSTVAAISIMGGVFAVLPAYEADLYGPKYVQAIHGRFLLAATVSTIAGPLLLLNLRKAAEATAIQDLLAKVDPSQFRDFFGTDIGNASTLIEAKTLTISKLMQIAPTGTIDPSPFIYNNTMYTMAGLVSVGAALHFMVKPVDKKFFEKSS